MNTSSLEIINPQMLLGLTLILAAWSLYWKGRALWRAARQGERNWFIALLVINTVGILEILYLYIFSKRFSTKSMP